MAGHSDSSSKDMLNFLTHKLRTHSINEENRKVDDDHDSGTESDEDLEPRVNFNSRMQCRISNVSPEDTGCCVESPLPDHHDAHSSEEELEVINRNKTEINNGAVRATSVCLPEKRKWSQIGRYSPENVENISHYSNVSPRSSCSSCQRFGEEGGQHSGSSDDEVHNFAGSMSPPVQFRTSPPLEALKPGRTTSVQKMKSLSPPAKIVHYEVSPRKRSRHSRHSHIQRPYLDFEKMQQVKARSLTTWHHNEDHGGEWSVYCW